MEHSSHLHPEFGLLSPTRRMRRELRIGVSSLLLGAIAGAMCVSGVVAFRHSDRSAIEIAEAPRATVSYDVGVDTRRHVDASRHASTLANISNLWRSLGDFS